MYPANPATALEKNGSQGELPRKVEMRYEVGLVTRDHWGVSDHLGRVEFRNAWGDLLLEMDGDAFR